MKERQKERSFSCIDCLLLLLVSLRPLLLWRCVSRSLIPPPLGCVSDVKACIARAHGEPRGGGWLEFFLFPFPLPYSPYSPLSSPFLSSLCLSLHFAALLLCVFRPIRLAPHFQCSISAEFPYLPFSPLCTMNAYVFLDPSPSPALFLPSHFLLPSNVSSPSLACFPSIASSQTYLKVDEIC